MQAAHRACLLSGIAQGALASEVADALPAPGADGGSLTALITDDINDEPTRLSSANKQMEYVSY